MEACPIGFVLLTTKDIEPLLDADGNFVYWTGGQWNEAGGCVQSMCPTRSPFLTSFLSLTRGRLYAVGTQVSASHQSPQEAIVALQAANKGIYFNGQIFEDEHIGDSTRVGE